MTQYLLISDIDDTVLGDPAASSRFESYIASLDAVAAIVYATGRRFQSVHRRVEAGELPEPLAVIGGTGSEIRAFPSGEANSEWIARMHSDWSAQRIREILTIDHGLELQPESEQLDFKVSFYFEDAASDQLDHLQANLRAQGLPVDYIYSSNRDLDFLPAGVNKGAAARFLSQQLGFDTDDVIVAGNSGNDAKLFEHEFRGIIVGNAHEELKRYVGPRAYLSPYDRADGVRDGLDYWLNGGPADTP